MHQNVVEVHFYVKMFALLSIEFYLFCENKSEQSLINNRLKNSKVQSSSVPSPTPYEGGFAKTLAHYLLMNEQKNIFDPNKKHQVSHLLEWKKFNQLFLKDFNQHFDHRVNYNPSFAMHPRRAGMFHSLERSKWYQMTTSHCVDWNPDSYSLVGVLCNGLKYFGLNLFKGVISFTDLITCAMIGLATGDSLFCLTWYLARFFLSDHLPDSFKEHYHYSDGRIRNRI